MRSHRGTRSRSDLSTFNGRDGAWRTIVQGCALASKIEKTWDGRRAENPIPIQSRSQVFGSIGILAGKKTEQGQCNDLQIEG